MRLDGTRKAPPVAFGETDRRGMKWYRPYRKFPQKRWMRLQASSSTLFDVA